MAIVFEEVVTGSTTSATSFTLTSWTPAADDLVLLSVATRTDTITVSASGNGLTFVQVADVDNTQSQNGITLFRAQISGTPSAGQITVNLPSNSNPAFGIAVRLSGVETGGTHGSSAVEASATDVGPDPDDADMLASVTTVTNNAWAMGFGTHRLEDFTVPSGETGLSINNVVGSGGAIVRSSVWYEAVPTAGSTQLGDTADLGGNTDWCMIAVSVKPSGLSVDLNVGVLTLSAPAITVYAPVGVTVELNVGVLTLSAPTLTVVPGAVAIDLNIGVLTLSAPTLTVFAPTLNTPTSLVATAASETRIDLTWDWS